MSWGNSGAGWAWGCGVACGARCDACYEVAANGGLARRDGDRQAQTVLVSTRAKTALFDSLFHYCAVFTSVRERILCDRAMTAKPSAPVAERDVVVDLGARRGVHDDRCVVIERSPSSDKQDKTSGPEDEHQDANEPCTRIEMAIPPKTHCDRKADDDEHCQALSLKPRITIPLAARCPAQVCAVAIGSRLYAFAQTTTATRHATAPNAITSVWIKSRAHAITLH